MSKDTKQSMDPFTAELEKAGLKDIQEAIIWKLGDIVKSSETIAELSGNCEDSFCHKDVLRSVAHCKSMPLVRRGLSLFLALL